MSDAHRDEIAKLETLYQENPEGRIFAHLAEAYRKGGEFDRAQQVLTDGLDRHPDYSSAHVVRGRVLMDEGRGEEAESAFRRVLDLDPHNLIAIRCLGDLARSRGDDDEALEYFHRLLEQEPGEEEVQEIVDAMTGGPAGPEEEPTVELGQEVVAGSEEAFGTTDDSGAEGDFGRVESEFPGAGEDMGGVEEDRDRLEGGFASAREDLGGLEEDRGRVEGDFADAEEDDAGRGDDWMVAASGAGSEETAAGAGEPDEPEFSLGEEIEEEPAGRGLAEEEPEDAGLRTETIAQVYARQGLYDRAAEVYRELSLARPDDEGLRERLAEMEELASAQTAGAGEIDAVSDFVPDEAGPMPGLEATDTGPEPEEAEPEAMELEGFQGGELDTTGIEAAALPGLEAEESDPETGLRGDAAPDTAEPEEDLSDELDVKDVPEPPEEMPWAAEVPVAEEPAAGEQPATAEEPSTTEEPDWLVEALAVGEEPPAETPHAWTEEEEDVDASPPIRDYFSSLLTWSEPGSAKPAEPRASEQPAPLAGEPTAGPDGEPAAASAGESAAGPQREGAEGPAVSESSDNDDDLDMFRSWLESLKQ